MLFDLERVFLVGLSVASRAFAISALVTKLFDFERVFLAGQSAVSLACTILRANSFVAAAFSFAPRVLDATGSTFWIVARCWFVSVAPTLGDGLLSAATLGDGLLAAATLGDGWLSIAVDCTLGVGCLLEAVAGAFGAR